MSDVRKNTDDEKLQVENRIKSLNVFPEIVNQIITPEFTTCLNNALATIVKVIATDYMKKFRESFSSFFEDVEKARNNPNSYFNYFDYKKKLDTYHWAWPYEIEAEELKEIISEVESEEQFDKFLESFFASEKMENMFDFIHNNVTRKHKTIFRQIETAYNSKQFALVNNAAISVLDNMLSNVLQDKGCVRRCGIMDPIATHYANNFRLCDIGFWFRIQMLSSNLNWLYGHFDFNNKIRVPSNKKIRRHLSAHGFEFSNKKIDAIMLLNSIAEFISLRSCIEPFYDTLMYDKNKKAFEINKKSYVINNRIKKKLSIECKEK